MTNMAQTNSENDASANTPVIFNSVQKTQNKNNTKSAYIKEDKLPIYIKEENPNNYNKN